MTDQPLDLAKMPLAQIVTFWRPGSHDWTWAEEYHDLMTRHAHVTDNIRRRVVAEGFGFMDHLAPVLLGNDGRVWDGHHRICLAIQQEQHYLHVEMAKPSDSPTQPKAA